MQFVLVHHEEAAAFMATGYAKATGKLGVCLATSGPGGIHLLNGLYDAKLDHQPVLAITGMQETSVLGTGYQQEVNLDKLYADVAEYDQMVYNPAQLPTVVDNAIRTRTHVAASRTSRFPMTSRSPTLTPTRGRMWHPPGRRTHRRSCCRLPAAPRNMTCRR